MEWINETLKSITNIMQLNDGSQFLTWPHLDRPIMATWAASGGDPPPPDPPLNTYYLSIRRQPLTHPNLHRPFYCDPRRIVW